MTNEKRVEMAFETPIGHQGQTGQQGNYPECKQLL
jgi:hypothetical protein